MDPKKLGKAITTAAFDNDRATLAKLCKNPDITRISQEDYDRALYWTLLQGSNSQDMKCFKTLLEAREKKCEFNDKMLPTYRNAFSMGELLNTLEHLNTIQDEGRLQDALRACVSHESMSMHSIFAIIDWVRAKAPHYVRFCFNSLFEGYTKRIEAYSYLLKEKRDEDVATMIKHPQFSNEESLTFGISGIFDIIHALDHLYKETEDTKTLDRFMAADGLLLTLDSDTQEQAFIGAIRCSNLYLVKAFLNHPTLKQSIDVIAYAMLNALKRDHTDAVERILEKRGSEITRDHLSWMISGLVINAYRPGLEYLFKHKDLTLLISQEALESSAERLASEVFGEVVLKTIRLIDTYFPLSASFLLKVLLSQINMVTIEDLKDEEFKKDVSDHIVSFFTYFPPETLIQKDFFKLIEHDGFLEAGISYNPVDQFFTFHLEGSAALTLSINELIFTREERDQAREQLPKATPPETHMDEVRSTNGLPESQKKEAYAIGNQT